MATDVRTLSRIELHELVWSKPATRLAAELGISDVMLGKLCRKLAVPKPPPGYWRKVATGQRLIRPPLPRAQKGQQQMVTIRPQQPVPESHPIAPDVAARVSAERQPENRVSIRATDTTPHALVTRAQQVFDKARANEQGLLIAPAHRSCLNLSVAHPSLERGLRIMDSLIVALEQRGYSVSVAADEGNTWVRTPEGRVQLILTEKVDQQETEQYRTAQASNRHFLMSQSEKWLFMPTGQLKIRIIDEDAYHQMQWSDTKRPLEEQLNLVIAGIIRTAEGCRLHRIRIAEAEQEHQAAEQRRYVETRRRLELDRLASALDEQATQWASSQRLAVFVQAVEQALHPVEGGTLVTEDHAAALWLRWAKTYLHQLDPIANGAITRSIKDVVASAVVRSLFEPPDQERLIS